MIDLTDQNSQLNTPPPTIPPEVAPAVAPEIPNVAVSGDSAGVPKWFYLVFGITLIIFFVVTTLLILSVTGKSAAPVPLPTPLIQPTSIPTAQVIQPTITSAPDDELNTLEEELNSSDLNDLDADLTSFDEEVDNL